MNKQIEKNLRSLSQRFERNFEDLEKELTEIHNELKKTDPDVSEQVAYQRLRGNILRLDGSLISPATFWTGEIFGDSGVLDFIDLMRKKAEAWFKDPKRKNRALALKMVDVDGTPLDTRAQIDFQDNPNKGKPLKKEMHSYSRTLYGIVSKGKTFDPDTAEFCKINIQGDMAIEISRPIFTGVTFRANRGKRPTEGFLNLNASDVVGLKFTPIEDINYDLGTILKKGPWEPFILSDLESVYDLYSGEDEEGKRKRVPILIEAYVSEISQKVTDRGDRLIVLTDDDVDFGLRSLINKDLPIRFGKDSRVIFVGDLGKISNGEEEEETYIYRIYGYYPLREFLLPPTP